jgi:uncharacterized protein
MPQPILERYIQQYIMSQPTNHVVFSWHGGEPMLAGLEFFREAMALQKLHRRPGMVIENTIQTNAVLIDQEWADFFLAEDFLVGVSVDGPPDIHDVYRRDKAGKKTFARVRRGLGYLQSVGIEPNFLCAVNAASEGEGLRIYQYLRDELAARFIQFIPVVEREEGSGESLVSDRSISAVGYGEFLKDVFDEWYSRDIGDVFIQTFEVALASWVGAPRGLCIFEETCGLALAVEHNGDVYSCDHFVEPPHRLGNIAFVPLAELVNSVQQREFGASKKSSLPDYCVSCPVLFACNGGCPKDRFIQTPEGQSGLNFLCAGLREFFLHIDAPMKRIALELGLPISASRAHRWSSTDA